MPRQQVPNYELASDVGRANLLTNGGFEIWQRGNGPFTASGAFSADRWVAGLAGSDTLSVSRDTGNVDKSSASCAACTFSLSGGGGNSNLSQMLKPGDSNSFVSTTLTASVRVRTSTANSVRIGLHNGSAFAYSAFHTGDGTYQTLTVSAAFASNLTAQLSVFFAASCTAYLDNAMLVVGAVPCDYVPLHPADDLARCLRYYEQLVDPGSPGQTFFFTGYGTAGVGIRLSWLYRVIKPVTPTVTKNGTWTIANLTGQPTVYQVDRFAALLNGNCAGTGDTYAYPGSGNNVTAEANP